MKTSQAGLLALLVWTSCVGLFGYTNVLPVARGGTGGGTAAEAREALDVAQALSTATLSGAGSATCAKWYVITTGSGFTHTLPAASDGCVICWKKDNDTDAVTLARAGADTIDGGTSAALATPYQSLCLRGRSGAWDVF